MSLVTGNVNCSVQVAFVGLYLMYRFAIEKKLEAHFNKSASNQVMEAWVIVGKILVTLLWVQFQPSSFPSLITPF